MKKLVLFAIAALLSITLSAQLQTPAPSPAATLTQVVGLTDVSIDYSRPAMRGRTIFGELVPKVAARIQATTYPVEMDIKSFTITIDDITTNAAVIGVMWENTYVAIPFEVPTDTKVAAAIDKVMNGPGASDFYSAAVYYLSEGKDIGKAKEWMDKAMSMTENPRFWQLRQQSLIYAAAGDKKGAIDLAKKSLSAAEKAGNADYVKMNKDSLKEWGAK